MNRRDASQESQTGRALLTLRELLLRGEFSPGGHLSELQLVSRLGASRTPVRMALSRLAHEGLLEAAPFGRFRARKFTLAEVWDAIELRGVLEGTAARLAAERLSTAPSWMRFASCKSDWMPLRTPPWIHLASTWI